MTEDDLKEVLRLHSLWLAGDPAGKRAMLIHANLVHADLRGANLSKADLSGAILSGANLFNANLEGADLRRANLSKARMRGANLSGADLWQTMLRGADLWATRGNGAEVRSLQCGTYDVTYTDEVMQIGCKRFALADWWEFDDDTIANMDEGTALAWWRVWKPILHMIIEAAPATPTGKEG